MRIRLINTYLLIFCLILGIPSQSFSGDSNIKKPKEIYKIVRKAYSSTRKQMKQRKVEAEKQTRDEYNDLVCIQCPRISTLADDINKIMRKVIQKRQKETGKADPALEETEKLEGLIYIVRDVQKDAWESAYQRPCKFESIDRDYTEEQLRNDIDKLIFVHSEKVDFETIQSMHMLMPDGRRTLYYKGSSLGNEGDMFVKIDVDPKGESTVSWYRISDSQKKINKVNLQVNKDKTEKDKVKEKEERFTIINITDPIQISNDLYLKPNLKANIRGVKTEVSVTDKDGEEYVRVDFHRGEGIEVDVPLAFEFIDGGSSYTGNAEVEVDFKDLSYKGNFRVSDNDENSYNVRYEDDRDAKTYGIGYSKKDIFGGSLSVEFQQKTGKNAQESGWVRYSIGF